MQDYSEKKIVFRKSFIHFQTHKLAVMALDELRLFRSGFVSVSPLREPFCAEH